MTISLAYASPLARGFKRANSTAPAVNVKESEKVILWMIGYLVEKVLEAEELFETSGIFEICLVHIEWTGRS